MPNNLCRNPRYSHDYACTSKQHARTHWLRQMIESTMPTIVKRLGPKTFCNMSSQIYDYRLKQTEKFSDAVIDNVESTNDAATASKYPETNRDRLHGVTSEYGRKFRLFPACQQAQHVKWRESRDHRDSSHFVNGMVNIRYYGAWRTFVDIGKYVDFPKIFKFMKLNSAWTFTGAFRTSYLNIQQQITANVNKHVP
jgi:hypothetical protein